MAIVVVIQIRNKEKMDGPRNQHAISALKHFVVIPASKGISLPITVRRIR